MISGRRSEVPKNDWPNRDFQPKISIECPKWNTSPRGAGMSSPGSSHITDPTGAKAEVLPEVGAGTSGESEVTDASKRYAPVTVLVDERTDGVHISYDRMVSLLAPYRDSEALTVARDLDKKIETLLSEAAG